jgi:type IV pilus assembly protein PilW
MNMRQNKQNGYTLIELMVAMLLGIILTGGVIQVFSANKLTFSSLEGMSRVQEAARFTLDTLTREARMIGYKGCMSVDMPIHNTLFAIYQGDYNLDAGVAGHEGGVSSWTPTLPVGLSGLTNPPTAGTDVLQIFGMSNEGERLANSMPDSSAALFITTPTSLADDDIVFLSDCERGAIFQVTQVNTNAASGKDNAVHNTGSSLNETKPLTTDGSSFDEDATVYKLITKYFYVAAGERLNDQGNQVQSLYVMENGTVSELIEGVEDLQVKYGVDITPTDANAEVNRYVDANNIGTNEVVSIRFTVTTNSINTATTSGDRMLRRSFTQTVKIRNRGAI